MKDLKGSNSKLRKLRDCTTLLCIHLSGIANINFWTVTEMAEEATEALPMYLKDRKRI